MSPPTIGGATALPAIVLPRRRRIPAEVGPRREEVRELRPRGAGERPQRPDEDHRDDRERRREDGRGEQAQYRREEDEVGVVDELRTADQSDDELRLAGEFGQRGWHGVVRPGLRHAVLLLCVSTSARTR
jgi:hypothetical protein